MDDVHDAITAVRRDLRRIEDDQAQMNRRKADNEDVEVVAKKQSQVESENRERFQSIQSGMSAMNDNLKRLADAVEALSDDHVKHKRKTASELEEIQSAPAKTKDERKERERETKPFLPMQLQIALYILAGVGLMALIQNAPAAMRTIPHIPGLGG